MLAQISVDHGELSRAISAHTAAAQTKLGDELGLNAVIEVKHQGASFSSDPQHSSPQEHRATAAVARKQSSADPDQNEMILTPAIPITTGNGHRLDIRA
jgi:hypothetical protein